MLIYRKASLDDALSLAARLRASDLRELAASSGKAPAVALEESWRVSEECFVAVEDDVVICIWGVSRVNAEVGVPWMVASDAVHKHARRLVVHGLRWVADISTRFVTLTNAVHADNHSSIKWLKALGFTVTAPCYFGALGQLFHPFYKTRHV